MNARYLASQFRPTTLAAMIADLLEMPVANAEMITALEEQLRATVGDEDADAMLAEEDIIRSVL